MIEYRQSIREKAVRLIEKNIREPADEIGALISEYIKDFDVTEQERILGVAHGVAVPGATATVTAAAVGEAVTLPLTAMVRQFGNCAGATYTVVLSAAATVSNIAVTVDKI